MLTTTASDALGHVRNRGPSIVPADDAGPRECLVPALPWPMQLIEVDGTTVTEPTWRDVVNVPAQGQVRVLIDFTRHPGRSVYHCHILDHEDAGMRATVGSVRIFV